MGLSDPQCCSAVGEHCALGNAMLRGDGIAPLGIDKLADRHTLGGLGVSFGWLGLLLARGVRWLGLTVRICGTASDEEHAKHSCDTPTCCCAVGEFLSRHGRLPSLGSNLAGLPDYSAGPADIFAYAIRIEPMRKGLPYRM